MLSIVAHMLHQVNFSLRLVHIPWTNMTAWHGPNILHKPYGSLQSLAIALHKWKYLTMDFVTGLPPSEYWRRIKYDSILLLVIVDRLTKMVHYEKTLTADNLKLMPLFVTTPS